MTNYTPDSWLVIKINNIYGGYYYRVFGSWYGGYGGSDSWRMNSGIVSVTEDEHCFYFKGNSGSVYKCYKGHYGASGYGTRVLENMIDTYSVNGKSAIDILPDSTDFINVDYKDTYDKSSN